MNGQSTRCLVDSSIACVLSASARSRSLGVACRAARAGAAIRACTQARSSSGRSAGASAPAGVSATPPTFTANGRARRQVGVDEHLVARLHAVDDARPDPARALDLELHARAGGAGEPARQLRRGLRRRRARRRRARGPPSPGALSIASSRIPPTPSTSSRWTPDRRQRLHPRPQLVGRRSRRRWRRRR